MLLAYIQLVLGASKPGKLRAWNHHITHYFLRVYTYLDMLRLVVQLSMKLIRMFYYTN